MNPWKLPTTAVIGGKTYGLHGDFRDILEVMSYLRDPELPEFLRWPMALGTFYGEPIPREHMESAARYLTEFINGGVPEAPGDSPGLLDWEQDGDLILADVNRVAGRELRAEPFVHWWTFLSWFHGVGDGQLSTVVSIRDKLRRGKPLEKWEQEYLRRNRHRVELKKPLTPQELQEKERLERMLR